MADSTSTPTPTPTATPTNSGPSSNRSRAEARRKRILEASKRRLIAVGGDVTDVVPASSTSGGVAVETTSAEDSSAVANEAPAVGNEEANVAEGDPSGTTTTEASSTEVAAAPKKVSGSARLAQMRRRRFKKSTPTTETVAPAPVPATTAEATEENTAVNVDIAAPLTSESKTTTTTETPVTTTETAPVTNTEKKKYIGVAKMRRKMLNEKKKEQQKQQNQQPSSSSSSKNSLQKEDSSLSSAINVSTSMDVTAKLTNKQIRMTLFFQLVTALCLFTSGVWFGHQNYSPNSPIQSDGYLALRHQSHIWNWMNPSPLYPSSSSVDMDWHLIEEEEIPSSTSYDEFSSEFDSASSNKNNYIDPNSNIDPLFRVNLDLYTQGPGFILFMARFAVAFHRFLTSLVLFIPNLFFGGYSYSPSFFCLTALFFRKGVQTMVLKNICGILLRKFIIKFNIFSHITCDFIK